MLPAAVGKNAGNALALTIGGTNGVRKNIPIAAFQTGGRVHQVVIPFNVPLNLLVRSASLSVGDGLGRAMTGNQPMVVQATPTSRPADIVINVAKGVAP